MNQKLLVVLFVLLLAENHLIKNKTVTLAVGIVQRNAITSSKNKLQLFDFKVILRGLGTHVLLIPVLELLVIPDFLEEL